MFTVLSPEGRSLGMYYRSAKAARLVVRNFALVGLGGYSVAQVRGRR